MCIPVFTASYDAMAELVWIYHAMDTIRLGANTGTTDAKITNANDSVQ